jgi:hypothetical protein
MAYLAARLHQISHPDGRSLLANGPMTWAQALTLLPAFLVGVTTSLLFANIGLWLIPPVRRILDKNATDVPGAGFTDALRAARLAMVYVGLPAFVLVIVAGWSPWER